MAIVQPKSGKNKSVVKKEKKQVDPVEAKLIVDSIELFKNVVPGDFATKGGPYARQATRQAVLSLVKRIGFDGLQALIAAYVGKADDPFRPTAGTVYEFCTYKLAKIETYLKKSGKLWAQKTISTPEQTADRKSAIKAKLEEQRRNISEAKKEWEIRLEFSTSSTTN